MKDNVKLGTLGDIFIGLTYRPEDVANEGTIVLRSSNIQNGRLDFDDVVRVKCKVRENLIVKPNDILMCSRNGSAKLVGKCTLLPEMDEEMSFGAFMTIIRTQHNPYLLHFFNSNAFRCQLGSAATTTINQITRKMLDDIAVPLYPKEQEDYIVSVFNQIDELIWIEAKKLDQFDELVKSRFIELFGDPITNSNNLPTERMELRFNLKAGITTAADDIHEFEEGMYEIPCYGGNGIRGYVREKSYTGNYPIIGRQGALCGNVQYATGEFHATEHAVLVSLLKNDNSVWVYHLLKLMDLFRYHTGAAQPGLAVKTLNTVEVIVADKRKQDQFAAFVEQTDKSKWAVQQSIAELEELKKSLMQKCFG